MKALNINIVDDIRENISGGTQYGYVICKHDFDSSTIKNTLFPIDDDHLDLNLDVGRALQGLVYFRANGPRELDNLDWRGISLEHRVFEKFLTNKRFMEHCLPSIGLHLDVKSTLLNKMVTTIDVHEDTVDINFSCGGKITIRSGNRDFSIQVLHAYLSDGILREVNDWVEVYQNVQLAKPVGMFDDDEPVQDIVGSMVDGIDLIFKDILIRIVVDYDTPPNTQWLEATFHPNPDKGIDIYMEDELTIPVATIFTGRHIFESPMSLILELIDSISDLGYQTHDLSGPVYCGEKKISMVFKRETTPSPDTGLTLMCIQDVKITPLFYQLSDYDIGNKIDRQEWEGAKKGFPSLIEELGFLDVGDDSAIPLGPYGYRYLEEMTEAFEEWINMGAYKLTVQTQLKPCRFKKGK